MELPKRKPMRLPAFDYSVSSAYFLTICTDSHKNLFWTDVRAAVDCPANVPLTQLGRIADQSIRDITKYYPAVSVDHYVIMPNHIHLLLQIHTDTSGRSMIAPTISTIVRQMKGAVTKQIGFSPWQKSFYDHVIRGQADYLEAWEYIDGNPPRWHEKKNQALISENYVK